MLLILLMMKLNCIVEILVGPPVICLFIIKFESARFTFEIFCFGNVANIPEPSRF